jgi:putative nucleotidyltransferase with HDIG domain
MQLSRRVNNRIKKYNPAGKLGHTSKIILAFSEINHYKVKEHIMRVALLAEDVSVKIGKDQKACFFAGLLHDIGKLSLSYDLFSGREITKEEYIEVKRHAIAGFKVLSELHLFTALCAGLHHALYNAGYGLTIEDFPKDLSIATIKKVLEISTIISICDFIDAFSHRKTKIKDGSDGKSSNLDQMLKEKYPDDHRIIKVALKENLKYMNV